MTRAYGFNSYGGPDVEEVLELAEPTPMAGELVVAVRAAGVNPVDHKIRAGYMREFMPLEFPAVFGREVAGVVNAVGQDVEGFNVGDEVVGSVAPGSGGFAEVTLVTADTAAHKPPQVSFTDAATLPVAASTAYTALRQLGLSSGETLLINGAGGGVGVAAAQLARDQGLMVIATAGEAKRELLESLGATLVTYGPGVADRVRVVLPDGVDAVLDLVGGQALRDVAGLLVAGGKLVSAADVATAAEFGGEGVSSDRSGVLQTVIGLVADGNLDPHVEDVRPLEEAPEAMRAVESGHARGKVVISFS